MDDELKPRRRVTGVLESGVSTFVVDEPIEPHVPVYGGMQLYRAWSGALPLELPAREGNDIRVTLVRFEGGQSTGKPFANPHWHDTLDVHILIAGELVQRLDDGSEVTMRPGDVIIQNGTSHAWEARSAEGALLAIVMHDAKRTGVSPPEEQAIERVIGSSGPAAPAA